MFHLAQQIEVHIRRFASGFSDEDGQTMAEYAVILAVIVVVVLGALTLLAGGIGEALDKVTSILPGDETTTTP